MFRNGDILVIYNPKNNGAVIGTHPFIVVNSEEGNVNGMAYDFAAVVMSSMTTKEREEKAAKYISNFVIQPEDKKVKETKHVTINQKPAFAYLNQPFFFSVEETRVKRIGKMTDEAFEQLIERMELLKKRHIPMHYVYDNLREKENQVSPEQLISTDEEERIEEREL